MDLATCLKKMKLVGVLAFATVDSEGAPQIRNISAIHYEPDALYFFTARGKNFCKELMEDGRVQILAYTKYKEMIRLSGKAYAVAENEQKKWMDIVFEEQPNASVPMVVMLCVWCLFRVSYITVAVHFIPDIRMVFWAYPLTWSISSVIFLYLFLRGKWIYGFEKNAKT